MSERDLAHHHKVLKQFLEISDDLSAKTRTNSSRAARAREKLLKLLGAQFRELSTDVYDELRRRIDESRGEPDFLLPKLSFHPKRNQARQKLSSLPQSRFKDLVLDILYEIERRELDVPQYAERLSDHRTSDLYHSVHSHHRTDLHQLKHLVPLRQAAPAEELQPHAEERAEPPPEPRTMEPSIGVQSTTVVPAKANLTWSSDEEEEENKPSGHDSLKQRVAALELELETAQHAKSQLEDKFRLLQDDYDYTNAQNKILSKELEDLSLNREQWNQQQSLYDQKLKEYEQNYIHRDEHEELKGTISALRLENKSLKSKPPQITPTASTEFAQQLQQKQAQLGLDKRVLQSGFNRDLERFLAQLTLVDEAAVKRGLTAELKLEVAKWQLKYEQIRAGHIEKDLSRKIMTQAELKPFISPQGLISLKLVSGLIALVETFLHDLDCDTFDTEALFDKASQISVNANTIAAQSDNASLSSNENSVLLREAVSYALTTTRYYALYSNILPRIIVERAFGEVCFTLCDLISIAKLSDGDIHAVPKRLGPGPTDSGVRPLRMANKLKEGQNQNANADFRHKNVIPARSSSRGLEPKDGNVGLRLTSATSGLEAKRAALDSRSIDTKSNDRASPKGARGSGVAFLTSKLNSSAETSPVSSPVRTTPTKKSGGILDKMKHFEGDTTNGSSPESTKSIEQPLAKPIELEHAETKSKMGLFQTLTNKLAAAEEAERSTADNNGNPDSGSKETALAPDAESVTPTKNANKGFFQSIREKLVPGEEAPAQDEPTVRAPDEPDVPEVRASEPAALATRAPEPAAPAARASEPAAPATRAPEPAAPAVRTPEPSLSNGKAPAVERSQSTDSRTTFHSTVSTPLNTLQTPPVSQNPLPKSALKPALKNAGMASAPPVRKNTTYANEQSSEEEDDDDDDEDDTEDPEEAEARQRQEYRKSMAAATFNIDLFDIEDPDNTLTQVLLYLEHQTVQVISTIQSLLSAIKKPNATRGDLREKSGAITEVISQMSEATNTSMNQTRNAQLKEHGSWVVRSLEDCNHRMNILCKPNSDRKDDDFADKNFKQRLAGISFDIAKCTKELVKTVEEASLKEDIAHLDAQLSHSEDLT
jgi:hypothetical protein